MSLCTNSFWGCSAVFYDASKLVLLHSLFPSCQLLVALNTVAPLLWRFQSWESETWPDGGWAVEGQVHLRLCFPPWHRREDVCDWADVCSGANEHDNHRLHAHLLQVPQRFHTVKPFMFLSDLWCIPLLMQQAMQNKNRYFNPQTITILLRNKKKITLRAESQLNHVIILASDGNW